MLSGYADMDALSAAVNSGQIFAYIAKPWEPLHLMAQVGAAARQFKLAREVEQERELLRALMENSPDLIYFKDLESRFTRVNQAHARNLGAKDAAECIGKSDADYFKPEDAVRWRSREQELMSTGEPLVDRIERVENYRGGVAWWSTTKVPMFDRNGKVTGIAGISRDITAIKDSEEMLREQSERYRLIIETANDAFIGMDPDGSITAWNPQAEATFGWTAAKILGRSLCDTVIPPSNAEASAHRLEDFLPAKRGTESNRTIELVALHRDGHQFPVEATVWPVQVGGAWSFNAFVRDITERRRAEETRQKANTLFQLLQSVTVAANRSSSILQTTETCLGLICSHIGWPVGHGYMRAQGSPEEPFSKGIWYLEDADRFAAFREISDRRPLVAGAGMPGRVLVGGKPEWIVDLADTEAFTRAREAVLAGLRSGFALPVMVKDKIIGVLEFFSYQTVQPDEGLLTILGHIGSQLAQVVIRQRAENDLQSAKESAESANLAKSEFLTTMSHEMRTPMNAVLGMADLLSESSLSEEQRDYVGIFQKAGASLLDLINNILDLSKVESGHVELESIGFDLAALLEKIIQLMLSRAQARDLQLHLEILPGVHRGLIGDPNRLRQILINLVGNALKFTEHGSVTLRVEPDAGTTGLAAGGRMPAWLRFSVVDTGIGIPADKTEMVFGRFNQADSSTTRKYGGTGLGLAISKGLVELMGGRISCTSELGKGSTFSFTAPFEVRDACVTPEPGEPDAIVLPPAELLSHPAVSRILIAEDSENNLALMKAYLKGSGFELDFAENGQIAVEKAVSGRPHLVLMDLQMPIMDGLEATRAIRQWEAKTHARPMPIIALTAHAAGEGAGRSLEAGCTEHLTKPIKKALLLEAISRHISGKIRISPPEGIQSLVPAYLINVRQGMNEILAAGDSKDYKIALRLGHQFKGEGEGYGFPEITRTGAAVELAAMASDDDEIRSQILALSDYLDRVEIVV